MAKKKAHEGTESGMKEDHLLLKPTVEFDIACAYCEKVNHVKYYKERTNPAPSPEYKEWAKAEKVKQQDLPGMTSTPREKKGRTTRKR